MGNKIHTNFPTASWFNDSAMVNNMTYMDYYNRLKLLAVSMFKWDGLPDSCNERFLEKTLYRYGQAVFVNDPAMGYLTLKVVPAEQWDVYETPIAFNAFSINYQHMYTKDECVLIRNNYLDLPTYFTIQLYAQRLYEAERTINVNVKAQKTPVLLTCEEKTRLTLKNVYEQFDGNTPVIFGDKSFDPENVKTLKTDAPFVVDKLTIYKHDVWNEALTFLGINNANTDKKERLITDEATANDEHVQLSSEAMLLSRQLAADQINKIFDLNISVDRRIITSEEISSITGFTDDNKDGDTNE